MSVSVENPPNTRVEENASTTELLVPSRRMSKRVVAGIVIVLITVICGGWYLYSRGIEGTDDAQVDGHLVPIASRVEGTIQAVPVDDNQSVTAGPTVVQLDPRDYQVALDQAQAQYDQAVAQLAASGPNVPLTRITNESDVASDSAGIAGAEAAVESARHDLVSATAKLKESQAVDERAQANFQRYKTLFDNNVVSRADYDQYKATAMAQVQTVAANQAAV